MNSRHRLARGPPKSLASLDNRTNLALSPQQRERLLDRLARGVRNLELGTEFGLSSKQIQRIRMGFARDIAKRRERRSRAERLDEQTPGIPASF